MGYFKWNCKSFSFLSVKKSPLFNGLDCVLFFTRLCARVERAFRVKLNVVLDAHIFDHLKLCLKIVNVAFFISKDFCKEIARYEVFDFLGVGDGFFVIGNAIQFDFKIAFENFFYIFTNVELSNFL